MELLRSTSHGGFSVRGILTFVMAVVITALLWATFGSHTPAHALDETTATWKGESLLYNGHQYFAVPDAAPGNTLGLPQGTHYYVYTETTTSPSAKTQKAFVIYFTPGTDPPTEKTATLGSTVYTVATKQYSKATDTKVINVTVKGAEDSASSCTVDGIGWIICPIAVFLAKGMDFIFTVVAGFMAVQPVTVGDTHSSLYIAWNIMRSIANVAFIIVFLIIIYSQLTNLGLSNYGLKKLLPRLIIAAVLVNVSYLICSIAVDISNIVGYSLQDVFVTIRENTFNITNDTWSAATTNWTTITTVVLSGGAIGVAGIALAGDIIGVIYLILPLLVGLILVILFVLLILAARQAIIIILIIISPLAFVAYLLPNTEQWFKRWRELFMTMLIFFPAFSLVFGGSQLAGGIILQNATSVFMIVLGLAVQVAPLVITPLILKFSGGVLGKIAGMVNDPRKGLLDRTKNWSKARGDMRRMQSLKTTGRPNPFRKVAQVLDDRGNRVKDRTAQYTTENENRYHGSDAYKKIHTNTHGANLDKERIENSLKSHALKESTAIGSDLNKRTIDLENSKVTLENVTDTSNAMLAEYRAGGYVIDVQAIKTGNNVTLKAATATADRLRDLQTNMAKQVIETAAQKQRTVSAQAIQQQNFAKEIDANLALQQLAGGIDPNGAQRALANAFAVMSKAREETISNAGKIIDYRNFSNAEIEKLAEGVVGPNMNIQLTQDIRAAAIKRVLGGPDTEQIVNAMRNIDFSFAGLSNDDREELQIIAAESLQANSARPPEMGAGVIGMMKQGLDYSGSAFTGALGTSGTNQMIVNAANAQKLDAGKLQAAGKDYSKSIFEMLQDPTYASQLTADAKKRLKAELGTVLDPSREASERLGDSKPFLEDIEKLL